MARFAVPGSDLTLQALPDELLGAVLAAAGREAGPAVTLVCHRWRRVLYEQPRLWGWLSLPIRDGAEQKWDSSMGRRLLQRVAGLVHIVSLQPSGLEWYPNTDPVSLDSLLAQLQPDNLNTVLVWRCLVSASAAALQRFSGLTKLELHSTAAALAGEGLLSQLSCLRHLSLTSKGDVPAAAVAAAAQLSHLSWLFLMAGDGGTFPAQQLHSLVQLPHLKDLFLVDGGSPPLPPLALPAPSNFPVLQNCGYFAGRRQIVVAGLLLNKYGWTDNGAKLEFEGPGQQVPLRQLLQALQPGGASGPATSITAASPLFSVTSGPLDPQLCGNTPQLSSVTCLRLRTRSGEAGAPDLNDLLGVLVPQAPRLASLAVWRSRVGGAASLGSSLVSLQGLTSLHMVWPLTDLPAGPYLEDLEHLSLYGLSVPHLPAALTIATRLSSLVLSFQHQHCLRSSDITDVLCQLPALKRLTVWHCVAPEAVAAELAALPIVSVELLERRDSLPLLELFSA